MPRYNIRCECGLADTIFRKIAEMDSLPVCACGKLFERALSAPMVISEFQPYQSPVTGKWIDSKTKRNEDLRVSGSYIYEPGVEKDVLRKREEVQEKAFEPVAAGVDAAVRQLVNSGKLES